MEDVSGVPGVALGKPIFIQVGVCKYKTKVIQISVLLAIWFSVHLNLGLLVFGHLVFRLLVFQTSGLLSQCPKNVLIGHFRPTF